MYASLPLSQLMHTYMYMLNKEGTMFKLQFYIYINKGAFEYNGHFILVHFLPQTLNSQSAVQILFVEENHTTLFTFND